MTDRTRLSVLDSTDTIAYALKKYLEEGYSRFPVVRDNDKDDVVVMFMRTTLCNKAKLMATYQ